MRFTSRQKLIAVSAASLVICIACLWVFSFLASAVLRDDAVRAAIQARLDGFAQDRASAQAASALGAERQRDITRIFGLFAPRAHPVIFLQSLEGIGRAIGASVAIEVDDAANDSEHLGFRVIVEGNAQDSAVRYVRLLERLPFLITVTQMSEEKKSPDVLTQSGPRDRLVVSLRVRTK